MQNVRKLFCANSLGENWKEFKLLYKKNEKDLPHLNSSTKKK